jgi:threonine dehydratase
MFLLMLPLRSSGNHGGAVALAAQLRGISATVVVPEGTPNCKVKAIEGYGGSVVVCEATMDGR